MIHLIALAFFAPMVWAGTDPPPDCESKLVAHIPESALVRHQRRFEALMKRFSRVSTEVSLNNGMTLNIASKEGFRNLPIIHPRTHERRLRILVRSSAETVGLHKRIVEDWNLFDLRTSGGGENGARSSDILVEIGDWVPLNSREMALHTLNAYVAMSMVPYFRHLIVHVSVFDEPNSQFAEEHELKREAYEEILAQQAKGFDDGSVIRNLNLPQVRFIATMLPVRLDHVKIVRSIGPERDPPSFSGDNGFNISLFYSAL